MTPPQPQLSVPAYSRDPGIQNVCVPEAVTVQAGCRPEAFALVAGQHVLNYHELNCQSNRVANYLRSVGVGSGDLVGLCLPRSTDMVAGPLGILKAAAAYGPMAPAFPAARLTFSRDRAPAP